MSLIDELHKLMKEKKYTFAYTAKAMNISSTALHLWLNGNYKGNVKKIEEAVSHFIDIEKLREGRINIDLLKQVSHRMFSILQKFATLKMRLEFVVVLQVLEKHLP